MRILFYFIIIFLAPALILLNFRLLVFSNTYYKSQFEKLKVYESFGQREQVDLESKKLIDYLCCKGKLDSGFFNEREVLHMADVKKLISLVNLELIVFSVAVLASSIFLIFKKQKKLFFDSLRFASLVTMTLIIVLAVFSFLNFDFFFIKFHHLIFQNNFWQLSETDNLIKLFPEQFFVNFANRVAIQTFFLALLMYVVTYILSRKYVAKKS